MTNTSWNTEELTESFRYGKHYLIIDIREHKWIVKRIRRRGTVIYLDKKLEAIPAVFFQKVIPKAGNFIFKSHDNMFSYKINENRLFLKNTLVE